MTAGTQHAGGAQLQSAERVLRVLETIGASVTGVTAAEVAERLGLNLSTTYRLLNTLQRQGYIAHQPSEHRYILGRTVDALGRALHHQLVVTPAVRSTMQALFADARAPAYLTVFRGDDIVVAHIEDSPEHPRIGQLHVGFAEASHATAFGKLMLAARDDAALDTYLERNGLRALTPRSVTDAARLREQLYDVRSQQLAVEVDEYTQHLACIAAPVKTKTGLTVGAVSVSVNSSEFSARSRELERTVRRGAWQVSAQLARG
ncbi:MAG: IclR family transcriptional regulator [Lacisediminihabitans sp.]